MACWDMSLTRTSRHNTHDMHDNWILPQHFVCEYCFTRNWPDTSARAIASGFTSAINN